MSLSHRKDFFQIITGSAENKGQILFKPGTPSFIINDKTKESFQSGSFSLLSLDYLRSETAIKSKKPGTFNIIMGFDTTFDSPYRKHVDIGSIQANPLNRYSTFQIASNFSTLEPASKPDVPENGITKYIYDRTMGPFACISAAPALIQRAYLIFYDPKTDPSTWRQTSRRQINLLEYVGDYYPVRNGYVELKTPRVPPKELMEKMQVGLHSDVQVTFGLTHKGDLHSNVYDKEQIIHQVFCSALDLGQVSGSSNYKLVKNYPKEIKALAQQLLDGQYEATIRSGILLGTHKIYLTLLGGGAFALPLTWIAEAIKKCEKLIVESGIEVIVIIYSYSHLSPETRNEMLVTLKEMVFNTGGETKIYN